MKLNKLQKEWITELMEKWTPYSYDTETGYWMVDGDETTKVKFETLQNFEEFEIEKDIMTCLENIEE